MRQTVMTRIVQTGLLLVLMGGVGFATPPGVSPIESLAEHDLSIAGIYPRVGDQFEIVYRFKTKESSQWEGVAKRYLTKKYVMVIGLAPAKSVQVVSKKEYSFTGLTVGETKEFRLQARIVEAAPIVTISADLCLDQGRIRGPVAPGPTLLMYLVDEKTHQYGTRRQLQEGATGVLGRYNGVEPQWLAEYDPSWEESNREIVNRMREYEPSLSDSEALCLHRDNHLILTSKTGGRFPCDSARISAMLKAGWLKAMQLGAKSKESWLRDFIKKSRDH